MKRKLVVSTLILLCGGFITKLLGLVIKIIMGRYLDTNMLGAYMMILPTFSLFINLGQFGLPMALSKLVAEDKKNNKKLFISILPILVLINIFLIFVIMISSHFISNSLLNNSDCYLGVLGIVFVLPFISISGIMRSYFFGKEKMAIHVFSNIVEDLIRIVVLVCGIPRIINYGISHTIFFLITSNIISELGSIFIFYLFLPSSFNISISDLKPNTSYIRECLSIGIPNTCGRLIGSLGHFLEPIILSNLLLMNGFSNSYITHNYGILTGFVIPILLLPSFFTGAISNAIMPAMAKDYGSNNFDALKKKLKYGVFLSLLIGFFMMLLFFIFPKLFLNYIYHTNEGYQFMRVLAPVCLLLYIQSPLISFLEAIGKTKIILVSNVIGLLSRCLSLAIFCYFNLGIWSLVLSISINVILVTLYDIFMTFKYLK